MTHTDYIERLKMLDWSEALMQDHVEAMRVFDGEEEMTRIGNEVLSLYRTLVNLDLAVANGEAPEGWTESHIHQHAVRLSRMFSRLVENWTALRHRNSRVALVPAEWFEAIEILDVSFKPDSAWLSGRACREQLDGALGAYPDNVEDSP